MKFYTSLIITVLFHVSVFCQTSSQEWYDKGVKLKADKRANDAIVSFKEAVKLRSDYKEAWYEMGWCQNEVKDYNGAITSLIKAKNLGLDYAKLYFELGYAFEKTNNIDSAISYYDQTLQLKDDYPLVFKQLAFIYYNKNDLQSALTNFSKFEEVVNAPITDYLYWYKKGYTQNVLKQYDPAKISLNKSLEYNSNYANTYLELGVSCKNLKQDDDAITWYKKAMELDAKSYVPLNGIGEVYRDNKKDMNEAINWYRKTLDINPDERKANFGIGYCNNSLGNYATAVSYLQKAIQFEPTYTAAYVELGYSHYKLGNNTSAIENLNKAVSLNPKNENARYYATLVYINQNDKSMAQKMVDELKTLNSKYANDLQDRVNKL